MARRRFVPTSVLLSLAFVGAAVAAEAPVAVSPGHASTLALVEARCPTFSWGEVEGAESYELVVYRLGEDGEEALEKLRRSFQGSVDGWTPALDSCLKRGGQYAWSVRAIGPKEASDWSAPSLFEVASGPSEAEFEAALQIMRQYVGEAGVEDSADPGGFAVGEAQSTRPASSEVKVSHPPAPLSAAAGDSDLMVNDAAVVTTATFSGAIAAINLECPGGWADRYTDCGNGTVRDNNTGLFWLKDASCEDLLGVDEFDQADWDTAEAAAAALADGTCGLTDGSQAGDWRQPTVREFCSAWVGSELIQCPPSAAPDSVVDSTLDPSCPLISTPNPFDGVRCQEYWSSTTPLLGDTAWHVSLNSGSVTVFPRNQSDLVWPVRDGQ